MLRIIEGRPNVHQALRDRCIGHDFPGPCDLEQLFARDETALVLDKVNENFERLRPKRNFRTPAQQHAALDIEQVLVEPVPG